MNFRDKVIIGFYALFAISFLIAIIYIDLSFEDLPVPKWIPQVISEIEFTKNVDVEKIKIFNMMTDIEQYPLILPKNVLSVKVLERNENETLAEIEVSEQNIKTKVTIKQSVFPYEKQIIEILKGDAKGTKITQMFFDEGNATKIHTKVELHLAGILTPFSYLPSSNLIHAMDTVITSFVDYTKGFDSIEKRLVDNIYREILLRPADKQGLEYYSSLLENEEITLDEIRKMISESDEAKILKNSNIKSIDELDEKSKKIVDDIYLEQLNRHADIQGMQYYASLLESNKITEEEIRDELFNSNEGVNIRLQAPGMRQLDEMYMDVFGKHADIKILEKYSALIKSTDLTPEDVWEIWRSEKGK